MPVTEKIESIYFGGGTPSLLETSEIAEILETLAQTFTIDHNAEITLEANPDDIDTNKVKEWMQYGINRLSVGIQSFEEAELQWMNRAHTAAESLASIDCIQDAGMYNFSADLIFGSPLLSNEGLQKNVSLLVQKNIPHLSCYALTVEPNTALYKRVAMKKTAPVDTGKQADQFLLLMSLLKEAGYEQYEISNYALPDMRSRHNSSYWQGKSYYGFGPSAHSFDGDKRRRWNTANNPLYIQQINDAQIFYEEETLTPTQQLNEYIMTAIRTIEGIQASKLTTLKGNSVMDRFSTVADKYIATGKMIVTSDQHFVLTREGKLFADGIAADLFF